MTGFSWYSIFRQFCQNNIPVFCPALTDGSLGDIIYFHSINNPGLIIDIAGGELDFELISLRFASWLPFSSFLKSKVIPLLDFDVWMQILVRSTASRSSRRRRAWSFSVAASSSTTSATPISCEMVRSRARSLNQLRDAIR